MLQNAIKPAQEMPEGATASIVNLVSSLRWADLGTDVRHAARRHLLDTVGVMVAGARGNVATQAEAALAAMRPAGDHAVPGRSRRADLLDAVFLAATAGHGIELDDGYRLGSVHPGTVVVPTLLALAQKKSVTGIVLLEAMVAGYETAIAIARAAHPSLRLRGFHPTAAVGVFGAAAAAARLRKLNAQQMSNAFGIAASSASGLFAFLAGGGDIKRLHAGHAAREGVFAALLAEQGVEGPPDVLQGRDGFMQAFASGNASAAAVTVPPAGPFGITDCYVKPYACCRHLQPAIEALIGIMADEKIAARDIQSIDVETYRIAAEHAHTGWDDFASAQLSFPFTMAAAALYGWIELKHFESDVRADPAIAELAARLHVTAPAEIDQLYPRLRPARVTVTTASGRFVRMAEEALGSALVPFDDDRLQDKFVGLAGPVLGIEKAKRLAVQLWNIEDDADVSPLIEELAL